MGFNNNNNTILIMGGREPREHMPLIFFKGGGGRKGYIHVTSAYLLLNFVNLFCCFVAYVFLEHLTHRIKAIARESTFFLWSH